MVIRPGRVSSSALSYSSFTTTAVLDSPHISARFVSVRVLSVPCVLWLMPMPQ